MYLSIRNSDGDTLIGLHDDLTELRADAAESDYIKLVEGNEALALLRSESDSNYWDEGVVVVLALRP